MKFDYYSCIEDNVVVDQDNMEQHSDCTLLGMFYEIKHFKKKLMPGLISRKLINSEKEKLNVIRYENREIKEKKQKLLAQKRFETEIPSGSIVINLAEILK